MVSRLLRLMHGPGMRARRRLNTASLSERGGHSLRDHEKPENNPL